MTARRPAKPAARPSSRRTTRSGTARPATAGSVSSRPAVSPRPGAQPRTAKTSTAAPAGKGSSAAKQSQGRAPASGNAPRAAKAVARGISALSLTQRLGAAARTFARFDSQPLPVPLPEAPAEMMTAGLSPMSPVVFAVMAAVPLGAQSQSKVPALPAISSTALPTTGIPNQALSLTAGNAASRVNGANMVIDQTSQRAIYNWQSYNIGSNASVTYQFNQASGAALNRVTGGDPSQILGSLRSTVPGANGTQVTGGTVLLINPNGILFGAGAQVNTGSLIASTLNVSNSDFLSGFNNSINSPEPTFVHEGGAELFVDAKSFVRVDQGAQIKTAAGGQVFLFGKNVENAGSISTPSGQTVLAGGEKVYLNDPGAEKIYASEVNPSIPALRGLLVEVGGANGSVLNAATGSIETTKGNATLVAMAVNQSGRIKATTSVTENGSVFLLARGGANGKGDLIGGYTKRATVGGELLLGEGSSIEITADSTPGSDGKAATVDGNAKFTASRVELAGQTVVFEKGATVLAPAAEVNVHAETVPTYNEFYKTDVHLERSDAARIVLGEGARIDVSGTTNTEVSVERNFVTTEILGAADLADAPTQRNGVLYRQKVTYDTRAGAPILSASSQEAYAKTIRRDVQELMSVGGKVNLTSSGAVVTHRTSTIDVEGGQIRYTQGEVNPTVLVAADGSRYTLDKAPKDLVYTSVEGVKTTNADPYGLQTNFRPQNTRTELGYVEGKNAGGVNVLTQKAVLDGQLKGAVIAGSRQASGVDPAAARAVLALGREQANSLFGSSSFGDSAQLTALHLQAQTAPTDAAFWADAAKADLPAEGRISAETLNASGFGTLRVTSREHITIDKGADLRLPELGVLELRSSGTGGITLGGSVHAAGGKLLAQTAPPVPTEQGGDIVLGEDAVLDVSGTFVNRYRDGAQLGPALAGGSVQLLSSNTLDLESNTRIDVSGGATVATSGATSGTAAGSIALESNRDNKASNQPTGDLFLAGTQLRGFSLAKGGSLRIKAAGVNIVAEDGGPALSQGQQPGELRLTSDFFQQGGFGSFDIDGGAYLRVADGVLLAPRQQSWTATVATRNVASGQSMASVFADTLVLPDAQRRATNLSLSASGLTLDQATPSGELSLAKTARIEADAGAAVKLSANAVLDLQGDISARGGSVSLDLKGGGTTENQLKLSGFAGQFTVGDEAEIDVSGVALRDISSNGQQQGRVLDGGSISLSVSEAADSGRQTRIEVAKGALLKADGASDELDVTRLTNAGSQIQREQVASKGGRISLSASDGGARVAGTLSARSGGAGAEAGALLIQQPSDLQLDAATRVVQEHRIDLAATLPAAPAGLGVVQVGADTINAGGFADVTLSSPQLVRVLDDVALQTARSITLQAQAVAMEPAASLSLTAPSAVTLTWPRAPVDAVPYEASTGDALLSVETGQLRLAGSLTLQGVGEVDLRARDSIRVDAVNQVVSTGNVNSLPAGGLFTQADVTLSAPQTSISTLVHYTLSAPGHRLRFTGGDRASSTPVSAGGDLTVNAAVIVQDGVVRAPLGRITFNASESLSLTANSLTSVSGAGLVVPVGSTADGKEWNYAGVALKELPEKTVQLLAPGQRVDVAAGAQLDLSGGGTVQAVEFVPGPGGSSDAFVGPTGAFAILPVTQAYAPGDLHIDRLADINNQTAQAIAAGKTITFGAGALVPAGTYAVLPARYALQPGAFLVTPAGTRMAMGTALARADGTQLVAGQLGSSGTAYASDATGYVLRTADQAKQLSEMTLTNVDVLVAETAQDAGRAVPRLAQDAGSLNIAANQLSLLGSYRFEHGASALPTLASRGGGLAIAADRIQVGGTASAEEGLLHLDTATLNAVGADSLTLGALRQGSTDSGRSLAVGAREVLVDRSDQALRAGDVLLAATETVRVADGAQIIAEGNAKAEALALQGDGALLRVSADKTASSQRTDVARSQGVLDVGAGSLLQGGAITAEATAQTRIAADADLRAQAYTVGASNIAVGDASALAAANLGADTLAISGNLAARLSAAQATTLRSFDRIDFHGANASLGGANLGQLTLDAPVLRVLGAEAEARAGSLAIKNSSGGSASAEGGTGSLTLRATGAVGTSGDLTVGPGAVVVQGAASTTLVAARSLLLEGKTSLASGGDLLLQANNLTAAQGSEAELSAAGRLVLAGNSPSSNNDPQAARATGGAGATLLLSAQQIEQGGRIDLASGSLTLQASGEQTVGLGEAAIEFLEGSVTQLAGQTHVMDGQAVATAGGTLKATAAQGNLVLADGSLIDVSAGGRGARAGDVTLSAVQGHAVVDGSLLATSAGPEGKGGRLVMDTREAFNLAQLGDQLSQGVGAGQRNFAELISVRNRQGDQALEQGSTLRSHRIEISADAGSLTVAGTLDASGAQGGQVLLAAGQDLQVQAGAQLLAQATAASQDGGRVALHSTAGRVALQAGAAVDTRGTGQGQDGKLVIRALREGNDVKVDPIAATLTGVRAVEVEAYRVYNATSIRAAQQQTYQQDATAFLGSDGGHAAAMRERLAGGDAALLAKLSTRAGVEVRSTGNLSLDNAWTLNGVGEPINLTLRAAGNLNVLASVSDGFASTALAAGITGQGGDLRLIGGADLGAAQLTRTVGSDNAGDVVIGNPAVDSRRLPTTDVLVRTTTGNIEIAAGRDVRLLNQRAAVYTTGTPVAADGLTGYLAPTNNNAFVLSTQPLLLAGGGAVAVNAARDVQGAADAVQTGPEWQWRGFNGNAVSWWSRYDRFRQGFGALGGGDVNVKAERDAVRVSAAAAENAYVAMDPTTGLGTENSLSKGSLSLSAGRDVLGGALLVGGDQLTVRAGRDIAADAADRRLRVLHDNTAVDISARGDVAVGSVGATLLNAPITQWNQANRSLAYQQRVSGTTAQASLRMVSDAGNASLTGFEASDEAAKVVPSQLLVAAPAGGVVVASGGEVIVAPAAKASVLIAGRDDVTVGQLQLNGASVLQATPQLAGPTAALVTAPAFAASALPQEGGAEAVRIVSQQGDVALGTVAVAAPLRVLAEGHVTAASVNVMHTRETDLSLVQAGGNVELIGGGQDQGWTVHGPGDQVVMAGGHVMLGQSEGFVAVGNRRVEALPAKSADLTILAGVDPRWGDYVEARSRYFHLLGGSGIDSFAGDLAAQLEALANNQELPSVGSNAAKSFAALSAEEQLTQARRLAGDAGYQTTLLAWMRAQTQDANLDLAGATAKLTGLAPAEKSALVGRVLGDAWLQRTTAEQQLPAVLAMAAAGKGRFSEDLQAFVAVRTGSRPVDEADALTRFAALPVEQQLLHMNRVLKTELREAGRAASALAGAERDAAYAKGYAALATLFPNQGKKGLVDMGASQIKTQQDGEITVLAPRGSVNVGRVTQVAKEASELGLVTSAGGDVMIAVRNDVAVNRSRVFTVDRGDILIWASEGNIDAGRGAKTVTGAPPPVYRLVNGRVEVDTSGSFAGSGIAVLNTGSDLDLYAPKGEINAGDAGIKSAGNAFLGAVRFVGADNLQVGGAISGGPPVAPPPSDTGGLALAPAPTSAGQRSATTEDDEERRKRAKRRNLLLDFLGFGEQT